MIKSKSYYILLRVVGLTYWRLNESDMYHPLPDSFDSGAYLLLQEASISLVSYNNTVLYSGTCDWSEEEMCFMGFNCIFMKFNFITESVLILYRILLGLPF